MKPPGTCGDCRYGEPIKDPAMIGAGMVVCRWGPPPVIFTPNGCQSVTRRVERNFWCWQFAPKEEAADERNTEGDPTG